MYVHIGNDHAIQSTDFDPMGGERVTELVIPEGTTLPVAFKTVLASLRYHIAEGEKPAWIESDNKELKTLLMSHFGLAVAKGKRPKTWGKDTGADRFAADSPHS